jgi:NADPH:quinone reductase-like Zn-dependent oxidoreductase
VLSPIEASVHYTPLLIAYFAYVDLARVKPGQFALVTDASHCAGPSFVQLGKALGVRVIAATKTADEREYLLSLGAEKVIVTEEEDLLMRINKITDNRGVDVVFDGLAARRCRCSAMCWRRVAAWCCMACKAATRRHSRPVRPFRRTFSSLCTASATSPASRSWASPGSRRLAACPA